MDTASLPPEFIRVGPLDMYHDVEGAGPPLVLLHPGFGTIASAFGALRPALSQHYRTIGVEQQAHGHTPDIDRPLSYEQMVEDTADLLRQLDLGAARVFGWSDGGVVALGLAARHPDLVSKVAIIGAGYNKDAEGPDFGDKLDALKPDDPKMAPFREDFETVAPDPANFPGMMQKVKDMYRQWRGWPRAEIAAMKAPLLVMLGDRDLTRLEHAIELYRLVPEGALAVLPNSDHGAPMARSGWVADMLLDFFGRSQQTS